MIISHQASNALSIDVSVIIPTYNRISMLEEALASVFSQEFDGVFEIIVVDDNSRDGTPEIVARKYPDVHLIRLEQNLGHGAARNRAIGLARGKYIAFLDSDDLWKPDYLKVQIAALTDQVRSFAVSGLEIWDLQADERRILLQKPDLDSYMSPIHQLLLIGKGFVLTPSSVVFPRIVFDEVGLFEERFRYGVDIDFYLRCLGADFNVLSTEHPTVIKREGSSDQLTSLENLKPREKSVFSRVYTYYHLYGAKNPNKAPSIKHIYIENHLWYANTYFNIGYPLDGVRSYLSAAHNGAPSRAFSCATKSILSYTKKEIKHSLKGGLNRISQYFISSFDNS